MSEQRFNGKTLPVLLSAVGSLVVVLLGILFNRMVLRLDKAETEIVHLRTMTDQHAITLQHHTEQLRERSAR